MIYQYISIHVPTGRRFRRQTEVESYVHFLKLLAQWNYIADGRWIYYPEGGIEGNIPPVGTTKTISEIVS